MSEGENGPLQVLVAGGGVAGLETCLALRDLAGDRVECTILTPEREFVYRAMAVAEPFGRGLAQRVDLDDIARDAGATLVHGRLAEVEDRTRTAITTAGERLSYDALVVAVGAGSEPAYPHAITWTPESDAAVFGGLLRDIEEGYSEHVAFVVPVGVAWPLPAYELALMTAWEAESMGRRDLDITIYTPESAPLDLFGAAATTALRDDLDAAGISVQTNAYVLPSDAGPVVEPGGRRLSGARVVCLPRAVGLNLRGLANDERGFIRCDDQGKVYGTATVWAAGDAIAFPVKQGGLAAQQAVAVAQAIAARAGADVKPEPFRPVLRGVLLTGRGNAWLRRDRERSEGEAERHALFWPPTKIAGRYLSPYLSELADAAAVGEEAHPSGHPVELDLERDLPAAADALRTARRGNR
ncbi:MAG TPA: FAD-dependent oxidoreductase [Solirubrobacter sp.]|nr:FAD-dependent oxidoreductase [Solirubrobacter sp.]